MPPNRPRLIEPLRNTRNRHCNSPEDFLANITKDSKIIRNLVWSSTSTSTFLRRTKVGRLRHTSTNPGTSCQELSPVFLFSIHMLFHQAPCRNQRLRKIKGSSHRHFPTPGRYPNFVGHHYKTRIINKTDALSQPLLLFSASLFAASLAEAPLARCHMSPPHRMALSTAAVGVSSAGLMSR